MMAGSNGVAGFSFTLGGTNPLPADGGKLRFNIKVFGEETNSYCVEVLASGNNTFMISDLHQSCWEATASSNPTPDATKLEALQWQYVTNVDATYAFDLCITELRVIPAT